MAQQCPQTFGSLIGRLAGNHVLTLDQLRSSMHLHQRMITSINDASSKRSLHRRESAGSVLIDELLDS
ncbi:hypothetical protein ASD72_18295 [Pseudoxanthomonas sp. Root630]|nr:hypothetical protein ASD72_18295 [Pseudoxanthomonas sp. Root630]